MEKQGDRIAGSRYIRWFCESCGDPIRVCPESVVRTCAACNGTKAALMPDPNHAPTDEDGGPCQQNAMRFLENDRTEL